MKPIAIATEIIKTISSANVIGVFLSAQCHHLPEQRAVPKRAESGSTTMLGWGRD
jgi:hypothetical protein